MYLFLTQRKVTRMEHEFQDIVIKTEYLKAAKLKIRKDIEFYKTAIDKMVGIILPRPSSTTWLPSDLHPSCCQLWQILPTIVILLSSPHSNELPPYRLSYIYIIVP